MACGFRIHDRDAGHHGFDISSGSLPTVTRIKCGSSVSADLQSQAEPPCRKDDNRSGPQAKLKQGRGDFLDDVFHLRIRRMKWSLVVRASPFDGVREDLRFRRIRQMSAVCVIIG